MTYESCLHFATKVIPVGDYIFRHFALKNNVICHGLYIPIVTVTVITVTVIVTLLHPLLTSSVIGRHSRRRFLK